MALHTLCAGKPKITCHFQNLLITISMSRCSINRLFVNDTTIVRFKNFHGYTHILPRISVIHRPETLPGLYKSFIFIA